MKTVTQVENVIQVDFNANANAIAHPASKNFPLEEDPLEQLLAEYDIEDEETPIERKLSPEFSSFNMDSSVMELLSSVKERMSYLNDSQKRLKYYLDESYID